MTAVNAVVDPVVNAAAVLKLLGTLPRILALGEPTHFEDLLLQARNDLFTELLGGHGYRTVAIESDCLMGLVVDDYVTGGPGTLDDVLARGVSHDFGTVPGNRELIAWMRQHNTGRPPAEQVRFAGFDGPLEMTGVPSPRQALTGLHSHLAAHVDAPLLPCTTAELDGLLGEDGQWSTPEAIMNPSAAYGRSAPARQLRLYADDLATLLHAQTPHLLAAGDRDTLDRMRLYARTATGLLRYHSWLADDTPARLTRLTGLRDAMMADNLLALAGRGPLLVHAHNLHLQRYPATMPMGGQTLHWWGAGAIVDAHAPGDYRFLAGALGTIEHRGVGAPPDGTLEALLDAEGSARLLADPAALAGQQLVQRESPWFGYFPLDPAHLHRADGIVYVRNR